MHLSDFYGAFLCYQSLFLWMLFPDDMAFRSSCCSVKGNLLLTPGMNLAHVKFFFRFIDLRVLYFASVNSKTVQHQSP